MAYFTFQNTNILAFQKASAANLFRLTNAGSWTIVSRPVDVINSSCVPQKAYIFFKVVRSVYHKYAY